MRILTAEFVKLIRPLTVAVLGLAVGFSAIALVQQQSQAAQAKAAVLQFHAAMQAYHRGDVETTLPSGQRLTCSWQKTYPPGDPCSTFLNSQITPALNELLGKEQIVAAASLEQNPLGVGVQAGGAMASLLGFVVVLILAAGHVGGEWSGRTLRVMLVMQPHRWRIFVAKALSLWIASIGLLVAAWAALAALAGIYRATTPIDPIGIAGFSATGGLVILMRAALVLAVYSVLGTVLAVVTRSVVGTLTAGLAIGLGSLMLGYVFTWASHHEFVYWVTGLMGWYDPRMIGTGTYWLTTFATHQDDATANGGLLGLAIAFSLSALVGGIAFHRATVTL